MIKINRTCSFRIDIDIKCKRIYIEKIDSEKERDNITMIIDNVKIYTEAGTFVSGGIITQGDKITEIYTEQKKKIYSKK